MNCEEISQKAIKLEISNQDIEIIKESGNGWIIIPLNDKNVEELREYIKTK